MVDSTAEDRLWSLVQWQPYVDANELLDAVNVLAPQKPEDFRTRVLLRDSYKALRGRWGESLLRQRLSGSAASALAVILSEDLGDRGFATLEQRLMESLDPKKILRFLRELGEASDKPFALYVGGSCALILAGHLRRGTEDIDIVDEIPSFARKDHALLHRLADEFDLKLSHFQSHFLPRTWKERLHSLGSFGNAQVYLVDVYDIFVGKLFSKRVKDFKDLQVLEPHLNREVLADRIRYHAAPLADDARMREAAEHNWYVLFGEALPAIAGA